MREKVFCFWGTSGDGLLFSLSSSWMRRVLIILVWILGKVGGYFTLGFSWGRLRNRLLFLSRRGSCVSLFFRSFGSLRCLSWSSGRCGGIVIFGSILVVFCVLRRVSRRFCVIFVSVISRRSLSFVWCVRFFFAICILSFIWRALFFAIISCSSLFGILRFVSVFFTVRLWSFFVRRIRFVFVIFVCFRSIRIIVS